MDGDTQTVLIIDDGTFRWGADREQVLAHLAANGWESDGGMVTEPPDGYALLCAVIPDLEGFGVDDDSPEWDALPALTYRDDDVWTITPAG